MHLRTLGGLLILCAAFALQFFLADSGIFADLTFAALITFASLFDFWELALFVALATFVINWKPAASGEIIVFACYPFAAYLFRNLHGSAGWLRNVIAVAAGFFLLSIAAVHGFSGARVPGLAADIIAGELFGLLIFFPLYPSRPL